MSCSSTTVLVVDDSATMRSLMGTILKDLGRYSVDLASDGEEALARMGAAKPDLLITDLRMPRLSGEALTARAMELYPELTILVTTGNGSLESAVDLMRRGVVDIIPKPFAVDDFLARVERALDQARMEALSPASEAVVRSLLTALERKDPYLRNHSARVGARARQLAMDIGFARRESLLLERSGLVHDLGKIGIPESVLHKDGPLDPGEIELMKQHPVYSVDIIRPLKEFRDCVQDVYHHHERIDGKGYPDGLAGDAIPLGARILAVCDAHDAMASDRPYRQTLPEDEIRRRLLEARGTQLDGDLVNTFLKRLDKA